VNVVGASEKLEGITEDIQKVKAKRTSHLLSTSMQESQAQTLCTIS
jgi:hypothetical protein